MRAISKIHLWAGLIIALFLIAQAVTGILITFRPELQQSLYSQKAPPLESESSDQLDDLLGKAIVALPDYQIERLRLPVRNGDVASITAVSRDGSTRHIILNPATGSVLAQGALYEFPLELALHFHGSLMMGVTGEFVILISGLTLIMLSLTGLILWWPGFGKIKRALRIRSNGNRALLLYDLHKITGVVLLPFHLAIAITGSLLILLTFVPQPEAKQVTLIAGSTPPTLETAVELANRRLPGVFPTDIYLKYSPTGSVIDSIVLRGGSLPDSRAWHELVFEQGRVDLMEFSKQSPSARVRSWLLTLHSGQIAGLAGRIAILLLGLALTVLAATGIWMWYERRKIRTRAKAGRRTA